MAIGGILKTISATGQSVMSILLKNKFLAIVFLLLVLYISGSAINSIFTSGYECLWSEATGNQTMLVDITLYQECILPFMEGAFEKYKLNASSCITYAGEHSKDTYWNETCQDVAKYQARVQSVLSVQSLIDRAMSKVFELMGRWFYEVNGTEIVEIFIEPNYCPELYDCLRHNPTVTTQLGLTPDCERGDFPTSEEYQNATIVLYPDGVQLAGMFYIDCVATSQYNWKPKITAFGIDFLNWKLWIFMTLLTTIVVIYRKWSSILKV